MALFVSKRIFNYPYSVLSPCATRFTSSQVNVKVPENLMDDASKKLEIAVEAFKQFAPSPRLFTPDVELNDEIAKQNVKGLIKYQLHVLKYMIYLNWNYNGFQTKPIEVIKKPDEGILDIKWQFYGKAGYSFLYFMDLGKNINKSIEERKDEWDAFEGLARFHLNEKGLVYKQDVKLLKQGNYKNIVRKPQEEENSPKISPVS